MKRVLIDGYNLGLEKGTGVATYARNLSYELHNLGHQVDVLYGRRSGSSRDSLLREIAFFDDHQGDRNRALERVGQARRALLGPLGHDAVDVPMSGRVVSRVFDARLPYFDSVYNANNLFRTAQDSFALWGNISNVSVPGSPDLAHWTYPIPVQVKRIPNLYTLHDLVPLRLPYTTLDNKRRYLNLLRRLEKTADHFITVSECSKQDIVDILGISPERVTNTYQSVSIPAKIRDKPEDQVVREVEGATGMGYKEYFLFWGSIEPKKNIGRMIEAFLASNIDASLVIVGAQAWRSEDELRLLNDANSHFKPVKGEDTLARPRVLQLSYAPFSLLVSLIRGAKAALFPSLYEGFGLPALEAMSLGTPVICSNTSSLPEVVGDAASTVDPYDTAALSTAIRAMNADADLRAEYSRRGVVRASRFTPEAYRDRLKPVYDRFL